MKKLFSIVGRVKVAFKRRMRHDSAESTFARHDFTTRVLLKIYSSDSLFLSRVQKSKYTRWDYKKHKEAARVLVHARVAHLNTFYGFKVGRISIRDTKTRWGSCSKKGNLNFSYKILFLPPHMADYIVVHELCHLGEFNHSENFWNLVAKMVPEHKAIRKELKNRQVVKTIYS